MSPRDSCFWMETDRADGFYESCHRMRVRATKKGWRRSLSFFLAFFFWLASLPWSCEDRREKRETPPADRRQRLCRRRRAVSEKRASCKMRARARMRARPPFSILHACLPPAKTGSSRIVYRSLTSQLISGILHFLRDLIRSFFKSPFNYNIFSFKRQYIYIK